MKKKNLERILSFIREEMMTTNSNVNVAGFSSKAPAKGPTAGGPDPVVHPTNQLLDNNIGGGNGGSGVIVITYPT